MRPVLPLVLGTLCLGAFLRIIGGVPLLGSDFAFSADQPAITAVTPEVDTPAATAVSFYQFLVKGKYHEAWEISVEPMWTESPKAPYARAVAAGSRPLGWTSERDFIERCAEELGADGSGLRLNGVRALPREGARVGADDAALKSLSASKVTAVQVTGHLLGACLIYRWDRNLLVANISGKNKVLLPGTKTANSTYHESWFSNVELIGSLRKGAP